MLQLLDHYIYINDICRLKNKLVQGIKGTKKDLPEKYRWQHCLEITNKFNTKIHLVGDFDKEKCPSIAIIPRYEGPQIVHITDNIEYISRMNHINKLSFLVNCEDELVNLLIKYMNNYC